MNCGWGVQPGLLRRERLLRNMTLREFIKSFSAYGFLPVFTKFASFLLVPVYVRVFSSADFGIVELVLSTMNLVVFAMSLEFYGAIGRFFYDRETTKEKQVLISTGFGLTLISALLVSSFCYVFIKQLHEMIFPVGDYYSLIRIGLLWSVLSAISTYLSVIPRYLKKAKQYVLFNSVSLVIKLTSTIFYVLVLKTGISGILWGNVTGDVVAIILYWISSSRFIRAYFSIEEARKIISFAIPLVPGVLIIGLFQPMFRSIMGRNYSLEELGIFSFASRIATILVIVETAIRLAWRPLLYENIKKADFGASYFKISKLVGAMLLLTGIAIIGVSKEIISIIGTSEYLPGRILIGGILIAQILQNLDSLRGFGYEVAKKTYMVSIITIVSRAIGIVFLIYAAKPFGLFGAGAAFMLPLLISYPIKATYTKRFISVDTKNLREAILWLLLVIVYVMSIYDLSLIFRITAILSSLVIATPLKCVKDYLSSPAVRNGLDKVGGFL